MSGKAVPCPSEGALPYWTAGNVPLEHLQGREPEGAAAVGRGDPGEGEPSGRKGSPMLNLCAEGLGAPAPGTLPPRTPRCGLSDANQNLSCSSLKTGARLKQRGDLGSRGHVAARGSHTQHRGISDQGPDRGARNAGSLPHWREVSGPSKCPQQQQTFRRAEH